VLAVEQHRRVVLLALADDDHALHRHRADELAHRVDGGPVAAVLVAAADPAAGGHGGRLGHPDELQCEVAVGYGLGHGELRWVSGLRPVGERIGRVGHQDAPFAGLGQPSDRAVSGRR
jgi:hypothetical protein